MENCAHALPWLMAIFCAGYLAIIFEHYIRVNKTAIAILTAIACWSLYILCSGFPLSQDLHKLNEDVSNVAQVIFFLLGAMTIVEIIDSHRGFAIVTDIVTTTSKRKLYWIISIVSFFLSAVLDNLTTTILMLSILKKIMPHREDRISIACLVVIAANAGGAWTPIGDVTTTMLWISGQITTFAIMKSLFIPSLISLFVPLVLLSWNVRGKIVKTQESAAALKAEPGAKLVFTAGILGLVFIPFFKALTGLPPFMGAIFSLAILWLITDLKHHRHDKRSHLRIPHILTKIDTSSVLFFLGILLAVAALDSAGILISFANFLNTTFSSQAVIATIIGVISAIIDNVPLVAATIGMYPLDTYPPDSPLWKMIAYAAGTGGSLFIIGSAAGVAMMSIEKMDFISYMKKVTFPAFLGYLAGMVAYLAMQA